MYRALNKCRYTHECQLWIHFDFVSIKVVTCYLLLTNVYHRIYKCKDYYWIESCQIRTFDENSFQVLQYTGNTFYYYVSLCISMPTIVITPMSCCHYDIHRIDRPILL
jgi:hypothetical protein